MSIGIIMKISTNMKAEWRKARSLDLISEHPTHLVGNLVQSSQVSVYEHQYVEIGALVFKSRFRNRDSFLTSWGTSSDS